VDYYARLPGIYAKARYNICLTSLQLPQGLNQRHFDIWMAGGLCLSDATPGLGLFPRELTRPITFTQANDIAAVAEQADSRRTFLIADWQSHLLEHHTYAHRVRTVLDMLRY
jgi:spore maturation protein CgeB